MTSTGCSPVGASWATASALTASATVVSKTCPTRAVLDSSGVVVRTMITLPSGSTVRPCCAPAAVVASPATSSGLTHRSTHEVRLDIIELVS